MSIDVSNAFQRYSPLNMIPVMRVEVVANALAGQKHRQRSVQLVEKRWQGNTPRQGWLSSRFYAKPTSRRN